MGKKIDCDISGWADIVTPGNEALLQRLAGSKVSEIEKTYPSRLKTTRNERVLKKFINSAYKEAFPDGIPLNIARSASFDKEKNAVIFAFPYNETEAKNFAAFTKLMDKAFGNKWEVEQTESMGRMRAQFSLIGNTQELYEAFKKNAPKEFAKAEKVRDQDIQR